MNFSMIDRTRFDDVFQYFDKEVILNTIDIFEKEFPVRFQTIRKNILENDFEALAFNLHSLKGVLGTFMAVTPFELSRKMEELAIRKAGQTLPEVYTELESASRVLLLELTEIRKELVSKQNNC